MQGHRFLLTNSYLFIAPHEHMLIKSNRVQSIYRGRLKGVQILLSNSQGRARQNS